MELEHFAYEGRQYRLAFIKNQFVVWITSDYDPFYSWWDDEPIKTNSNTKNPTKLVRKVWRIVSRYIYRNKIKYFQIVVSDPKRSRIYRKFLTKLTGYQCYEFGYSFCVVKTVGEP